jgi:hypothetical protein
MNFAKKNELIIKHKSEAHFYADLELFKKHFPNHHINKELSRANRFTFERLDGQMLNVLLDKVSLDEILANRNALSEDTPPADANTQPPADANITPPADANTTPPADAGQPADAETSKKKDEDEV